MCQHPEGSDTVLTLGSPRLEGERVKPEDSRHMVKTGLGVIQERFLTVGGAGQKLEGE